MRQTGAITSLGSPCLMIVYRLKIWVFLFFYEFEINGAKWFQIPLNGSKVWIVTVNKCPASPHARTGTRVDVGDSQHREPPQVGCIVLVHL